MKIAGIGMIFTRGLGIDSLENALQSGWRKPGEAAAHPVTGGTLPAYLVDLNALPVKALLKKVRRSDAVSRMSVVAASDALTNSGIETVTRKKLGIIISTAFGPHVTTFEFLDDGAFNLESTGFKEGEIGELMSWTKPGVPALPDPSAQKNPTIKADHFIEIYCSKENLKDMQAALDEWGNWNGVTINIS